MKMLYETDFYPKGIIQQITGSRGEKKDCKKQRWDATPLFSESTPNDLLQLLS